MRGHRTEKRAPTDNSTDTSTDFTDLRRARVEWRLATSREMILNDGRSGRL